MASIIRLKRSTTPGSIPTTSDISTGEVALNLSDGRLFASKGSSVFEVGANVHSLSVGSGGFSFANGAVTFPGGDGAVGQTLVTDGSGNLSFQNLDVGNNYTIVGSTDATQVESTLLDLQASDSLVSNPDGFLSFRTGADTVAKVPYFGTATDGVNVTLDLGDDVASNTALTALTGRVDTIDGGSF